MPQIIPINKLKDTAQISNMCHETKDPIYITKNGYGDMVIMSMESFEEKMKKLQIYQELEISEHQIENGQTLDAGKALNALRKKYGL